MLAVVLVMAGAGLFAVDVDGLDGGPLTDFVSFDTGRAAAHLHHVVFNIGLTVVGLHVAAIAFYRIRLKTDLITPMITGRRR